MTWDELKQIRVREYNRPDGSPCPVCNGSGHVMEVWSNDEHFHGLLTICPECGSVRVREDDARKAGNAPRYGDYMDNEAWQRTLHRKAGEFAQRPAGVFYIGRSDRHRQEPFMQQDLLSPYGEWLQWPELPALESLFPAQLQRLAAH